MKKFRKPLLGILAGGLLLSSVFAAVQQWNNSTLELSQKRMLFTDTGRTTGTKVMDINTGGNIIAYGPLLDGGLTAYITGVNLSGYLTGFTESDPVFLAQSGDYYTTNPLGYITGASLSGYVTVTGNIWTWSGNLLKPTITQATRLQVGNGANASGVESIAMGNTANARGINSIALGGGVYAYQNGSIAIGGASMANAQGSIVIGGGLNGNAIGGFNIGSYNLGLTNSIFELGMGNQQTGKNAITVYQNGDVQLNQYTTDGFMKFSSSTGMITVDTNIYLTGEIRKRSGEVLTTVLNQDTKFQVGNSTVANATGSVAIGDHLTSDSEGGMVVGRYNVPLPNTAFIVGNGTGVGSEDNAFIVYSDKQVQIPLFYQDGLVKATNGGMLTQDFNTYLTGDMYRQEDYLNDLLPLEPGQAIKTQSGVADISMSVSPVLMTVMSVDMVNDGGTLGGNVNIPGFGAIPFISTLGSIHIPEVPGSPFKPGIMLTNYSGNYGWFMSYDVLPGTQSLKINYASGDLMAQTTRLDVGIDGRVKAGRDISSLIQDPEDFITKAYIDNQGYITGYTESDPIFMQNSGDFYLATNPSGYIDSGSLVGFLTGDIWKRSGDVLTPVLSQQTNLQVGNNIYISGFSSTAIGDDINIYGPRAVAIGNNNTINNELSFILGYSNTITGFYAVAIGDSNSIDSTTRGHVLGSENTSIGNNNIIGQNNYASGDLISLLGSSNTGLAGFQIGIGDMNTMNGAYGITLGRANTTNTNTYSMALGTSNTSSGQYSTAIGYNSQSLGQYSTAIGHSNIADGEGSIAIGKENTTSADYAQAIGYKNIVSGAGATAVGRLNTGAGNYSFVANYGNSALGGYSFAGGQFSRAVGLHSMARGYNALSNGEKSIAIGNDVTSNGTYSFAMGNGSSTNNTGAFAMGNGAKALGQYSTAMGYNTTGAGIGSIALGGETTASGEYSAAFGILTYAGGYASIAGGQNSFAGGQASLARGSNAAATARNAIAFGDNTIARGEFSSAFGISTVSSGTASTAFGSDSDAIGDYTTAFGYYSLASGEKSTAFGDNTIANAPRSTAFGKFNVGLSNSIFELGYGTGASSRKNMITALDSGLIGIKNDTPQYTLDVNGSIQSNTAFYLTGGTIPRKIVLSGDNLSFQAFTGGNRVERSAMTP